MTTKTAATRETDSRKREFPDPRQRRKSLRSSYDINLQNLFRLQRFFMASMRRPRLVGLSQA